MKKNKDELILDYLKKPIKIGDMVNVRGLDLRDKTKWSKTTSVVKIEGDDIYIQQYGYNSLFKISKDDYKKDTLCIGYNNFTIDECKIRNLAFSLDSILMVLGMNTYNDDYKKSVYNSNNIIIKDSNFNPFVMDKNNNKHYYQRPFVWSIKDCQHLIDSIYNNIDCGKIVVRKRSFKELDQLTKRGETDVAFNDIIDGKQRIMAIHKFINNEYPDSYGNLYKDLSSEAHINLMNSQLITYGEIPENTKDELILLQFLKLNLSGIPQSIEHIDFVQYIYKNISQK